MVSSTWLGLLTIFQLVWDFAIFKSVVCVTSVQLTFPNISIIVSYTLLYIFFFYIIIIIILLFAIVTSINNQASQSTANQDCCWFHGKLVMGTVVSLTATKFKSLCFRCCASPLPILRTISLSWLWMTAACFLQILDIKSYTYGIWNSVYISRIGVRFGRPPIILRTLFCNLWSFIKWVSAADSQVGQA
jgi:hypothetical protein